MNGEKSQNKKNLEIKTRRFSGDNEVRLESKIREFIENIGGDEYVINQSCISMNPNYIFEVEYYVK
ncbi:MAG: hypothetical protein QY303_06500 [Vicingaceae bacterium]|nr:MAG: hypothetical protein QY303_06500 [Vicingaceae bacterium]